MFLFKKYFNVHAEDVEKMKRKREREEEKRKRDGKEIEDINTIKYVLFYKGGMGLTRKANVCLYTEAPPPLTLQSKRLS